MFRAIIADGGIRDLNAQLGQFGLNASAAPSGIFLPHSANQGDEFAVAGGSSKAEPGFPSPEKVKAATMPSDDGSGLEEDQGLLPL